jgi:hypothetical protein
MSQCFLNPNAPIVEGGVSALQNSERDYPTGGTASHRLRVLIIGSRDGVIETIYDLYHRGFAEVSAWSPLLPAPSSGEVMSILTRDRRRGG